VGFGILPSTGPSSRATSRATSRSSSKSKRSDPESLVDQLGSDDEEKLCSGVCTLCFGSCAAISGHRFSCRCHRHNCETPTLPAETPVDILLNDAVDPKTLTRYKAMFSLFTMWLAVFTITIQQALTDLPRLDKLMCDYIQDLCNRHRPVSHAATVLSALQHFHPITKGHLKGSWRSYQAWKFRVSSTVRAAWPVELVFAVTNLAFRCGESSFALFLLLSFHCLLRPAEACSLQRKHIFFRTDLPYLKQLGLVVLENTKTKRKIKSQHVLIEWSALSDLLEYYLGDLLPDQLVFPSYARVLDLTKHFISYLLGSASYLPGGLRGGGATFHYLTHRNIPELQRRGRWLSVRTLEHYIQIAMPFIAVLSWDGKKREKILKLAAPLAALLDIKAS
jgi:hypothetical protein